MRARAWIAVLAPLLVIVAGWTGSEYLASLRSDAERSAPEPIPVLVAVVRPGSEALRPRVVTHGEVVPHTELDLVAEVTGRVTALGPELVDGAFFEAGELLVRIDDGDYRAALARADLELARARRHLAEEEAAAEVARREWERAGRGAGTPLALREPQLAEARAGVAAASAELEQRRRDLERTELRAPFLGRVHRAPVEVGQYVTRGQVLARLWAVDHVEVRLPLPDAQLAFLDLPLGQRPVPGADNGDALPRADPTVDLRARFAGREHVWEGRIVRVESALDPRTRMVVAVARVEDPYGLRSPDSRPPLAVGLFVRAELEGRLLEGALSLPREALRGANRVWVVDEHDRLRILEVEVLRSEGGRVVVAGGLERDARVVISPLELATDGQPVRVEDAEPVR